MYPIIIDSTLFFSSNTAVTMFVPIALSITPSTMMHTHYQGLFSRPDFLHRTELATPCVRKTLTRVRADDPEDYASLLRLTNWLFFVEHLLRTQNPYFVVEDKVECRTHIRSVVSNMQRILRRHHGLTRGCDVSYPFRHEMFIGELLEHRRSPKNEGIVYTTWRQLHKDGVEREGRRAPPITGTKQLQMYGRRRVVRHRVRRTHVRPNSIRFKL